MVGWLLWLYLASGAGIVAAFLADLLWIDVDYRVAANVSLVFVTVFTTLFVVLYGVRSKWRTNLVGKIFFIKAVFLPLMLWQIVLATWGDTDYPGRQPIRFAIYSLAAVAYLSMVLVLWREQRRDREVIQALLTQKRKET